MSEQKNDPTMQMVDAILAKGKAKNQAYFAKEKAKLVAESEQAQAQLALDKTEQCQRISKSLSHEYAQKEQREILVTKQGIVQQKQQYLSQIFEKATLKMASWNKEQFLAVVSSIFTNNELVGDVTVTVGELSQQDLTAEDLNFFSTQAAQNVTYTLAAEPLKNEGGFILAQAGIEYNFLFSSILAQISEEKEFEIVAALFADGSD